MDKILSLDLNDKTLDMMTAEEKEEYCQKNFGTTYEGFLDLAFPELTPEEKEQLKKDYEYPKRE